MPRKEEIIRLAETNLDGTKYTGVAIRGIRGVSFMFGNAVAKVSGFEDRRLSELKEEEMKKLEDVIFHPEKYGIPAWLYNRRREPATNISRHLAVSQLDFAQRLDINEMKKIRSYRGVRHGLGLPVRGQRTRSSFRTGTTVGVKRKDKGKGGPKKEEGK
jgi:small subunit ribosomal protein S13